MPSVASSALTCWLTAACVTHNSSAARVKLSLRAADSKALRALSGGKRRSIYTFINIGGAQAAGQASFSTSQQTIFRDVSSRQKSCSSRFGSCATEAVETNTTAHVRFVDRK